jgi:hypothetical protein
MEGDLFDLRTPRARWRARCIIQYSYAAAACVFRRCRGQLVIRATCLNSGDEGAQPLINKQCGETLHCFNKTELTTHISLPPVQIAPESALADLIG